MKETGKDNKAHSSGVSLGSVLRNVSFKAKTKAKNATHKTLSKDKEDPKDDPQQPLEQHELPVSPKFDKERFFKVIRLVSLGDSLGFGTGGGILEYSQAPFQEDLFKQLAEDVLDVKLTPDRFPISDDSITTHKTVLALRETFQQIVKRDQNGDKKQQEQEVDYEPNVTPQEFAKIFAYQLLEHLIELQRTPDTVERSWGRMIGQLWDRFPSVEDKFRDLPLLTITPFDPRGGGNGGAMHAAPIGLLFSRIDDPNQRQFLIATAVENGRVTHNHPTGFLGSTMAAYFTACAVHKKNVQDWPTEFLDKIVPEIKNYLKETNTYTEEYEEGFQFFESKWRGFISSLQLDAQTSESRLPTGAAAHDLIKKFAFGFKEDDQNCYYWSGSSGHDVAMYAIYGLLTCGGSYRKFIDVVCNHPGDTDTTGAVALPLFGLLFGFDQIPSNHLDYLERNAELRELCDASFPFFEQFF